MDRVFYGLRHVCAIVNGGMVKVSLDWSAFCRFNRLDLSWRSVPAEECPIRSNRTHSHPAARRPVGFCSSVGGRRTIRIGGLDMVAVWSSVDVYELRVERGPGEGMMLVLGTDS